MVTLWLAKKTKLRSKRDSCCTRKIIRTIFSLAEKLKQAGDVKNKSSRVLANLSAMAVLSTAAQPQGNCRSLRWVSGLTASQRQN